MLAVASRTGTARVSINCWKMLSSTNAMLRSMAFPVVYTGVVGPR